MGCSSSKKDDGIGKEEEKEKKVATPKTAKTLTVAALLGERSELAFLSLKSGETDQVTPYAAEFTQAMLQEGYLGKFSTCTDQTEAKNSNGFMLQIEEQDGLDEKQTKETEMAKETGIKVFRTYTDNDFLSMKGIRTISAVVQAWYTSNGAEQDMENVFLGKNGDNATRPRKQPL